jgi:hypothetical protein
MDFVAVLVKDEEDAIELASVGNPCEVLDNEQIESNRS